MNFLSVLIKLESNSDKTLDLAHTECTLVRRGPQVNTGVDNDLDYDHFYSGRVLQRSLTVDVEH